MNESLIDSIIVRESIEKERKYMLDLFGELEGKIGSLSKVRVKFEGAKDLKTLATAQREYNKEATESIKIQDKIVQSSRKQKQAQDELQKIEQGLIKTYEKRQALGATITKNLLSEKEALRQRTAELKNNIREEQNAKGSLEQRRAALIRLQGVYDKLAPAERNAASGQRLQKIIADVTTQVKKLEKDTGRTGRNVGNYSDALKILEGELTSVRRKLDDYNKSGKVSTAVIEQLRKEEGLLVALVNNQVNGFASATAELKNNEKALQALAAAGQQNTEFYRELLKQTAELKDNVTDLKAEIKNLASDTFALDGLVGSAQLLAGTYAVAVESAKVFGVESEALAEAQQKSQAILAVLAGLQAIQNALQKESATMLFLTTIRTKAAAAAQAVFAAAVGTSTGALRVLRIALLSTGIGAILLLLPLLVSGISRWTSSTKLNAEEQKELNSVIKEGNEALKDRIEIINNVAKDEQRALKNQLALLEATGKKTEEAFDLRQKIAALDKQQAQEVLNQFGLSENKLISLEGNITKIQDQLEEARRIKIDAIETGSDRKVKAATTNIERLTTELDKLKFVYDVGREALDKLNDAQLESSKIEIERAKFKFDNSRADQKAALEINRILLQAEIEKNKQIAEAENFSITARIKARQRVSELENAIIVAERNFELKEENLRASEIEAIRSKANAAIRANDQQLASDLIAIWQNYKQLQKESLEQDIELGASLPKTTIEERVEREATALARRENYIEESKNILLKSLAEEEIAKIKGAKTDEERVRIEEEFARKRQKVELDANRAILQSALTTAEAKIKILKAAGQDLSPVEREIAEIKKQLADLGKVEIELQTDGAKAKMEEINEALGKVADRLTGAFDAIGSIFTAAIDRQKNAIQSLIDQSEERKNKEIEAVNATSASEQEKANRIANINSRAAVQKEQLEARQRQLDLQRARFDKARTITQIILNTAQGVTAALTSVPPNIPLSILVGATGAIQLAGAIAAPLPKFVTGTTSSPEGWALTDEKGPEHYQEPGGKSYWGNDYPTLRYLKKGTKITPHDEAMGMKQWASMERLPKGSDLILEMSRSGGVDNYLLRKQIEVSEQLIQEQQETKQILKKLKLSVNVNNEIDIGWLLDKQRSVFD